ncbi:MAG: hypothetical protein V7782_07515 [Psychromonas sp.]
MKQRAILVGSRILARDITSDLSSNSSEAIDMETDIGWCSSLDDTAIANSERVNTAYLKASQQVIHDYQDDRVRD